MNGALHDLGPADAALHGSDQTPMLTVRSYDEAERSAMSRVSNRIIACTRPTFFLNASFPCTVGDEAGLRRYAGGPDLRYERYLAGSLGGLSPEEFELFAIINRHVADITHKYYGERRVAGPDILSAIEIYRHLRAVYAPGSTILELGPGCGYVGALLLLSGYGYIASDISQAFYLYQNHLLRAVTGGQLIELATDDRELEEIAEVAPGTALHVPWWKYVVPKPAIKVQIDAITANHMLCEMSNVALSYNLKLWSTMGADLVFDSWGSALTVPVWLVAKRLHESGYVFAYSDGRFNALVPRSSGAAQGAATLPNVDLTPDQELDSLEIYTRLGLSRLYSPPTQVSPGNPIAAAILGAEANDKRRRSVGPAEVHAFLSGIVSDVFVESRDEAFDRFVGIR